MSTPFENAPPLGPEFREAQPPDQLDHRPPRKVWDQSRVLAPTPLGTIEVDVIRELDPGAQRAIHQAQAGPDEFEERMRQRFNHARKQRRGPRR